MATQQGFDVQAARKAGYTDDEILGHLTQTRKFDVQNAVKSGYSKPEIIDYLAGSKPVAQTDRLVTMTNPQGGEEQVPVSQAAQKLGMGYKAGQPSAQAFADQSLTMKSPTAQRAAGAAVGVATSVGIPESQTPVSDAAAQLFNSESPYAKMVPFAPAPIANLVGGAVESAASVANKAKQKYGEAINALTATNVPWVQRSQNVANAATQGNAYALATAVPVLGPMAAQAGEAIGNLPNTSDPYQQGKAVGEAAGVVGQAAAPMLRGTKAEVALQKVAKPLETGVKATAKGAELVKQGVREMVDPTTVPADSSFIKATKPNVNIRNVREKINTALPEVRRVLDEQGIDPAQATHQQALDATLQAKRDVWAAVERQLSPNGKYLLPADEVAAKINASVDGMTPMQQRRMAGTIEEARAAANDYAGKGIPLEQIEARIQELNNELESKQVGGAKEGTLRKDPRYAFQFAELDALRNLESRTMDMLAGDGLKDLKTKYGALKETQKILEKSTNVSERASEVPLFEGLGRMASAGKVAKGVFTLPFRPLGALGDIGEGASQYMTARKAALMNNREFMLQQALSKTSPAENPMSIGTQGGFAPPYMQPVPLRLKSAPVVMPPEAGFSQKQLPPAGPTILPWQMPNPNTMEAVGMPVTAEPGAIANRVAQKPPRPPYIPDTLANTPPSAPVFTTGNQAGPNYSAQELVDFKKRNGISDAPVQMVGESKIPDVPFKQGAGDKSTLPKQETPAGAELLKEHKAPEGLVDAARSRGNEVTFRRVRNPEEAAAIIKSIQEGNPSAGFVPASVVDGHNARLKAPAIEKAKEGGAVPVFTSPYPAVTENYKGGAGLTIAIEYSPEGTIYKSSRTGDTGGSKAYNAQFADAEHVIDARTVKNVYVLSPEQQQLVANHYENLNYGFRNTRYKNVHKDIDRAATEQNIEAMRNLRPPVSSPGRREWTATLTDREGNTRQVNLTTKTREQALDELSFKHLGAGEKISDLKEIKSKSSTPPSNGGVSAAQNVSGKSEAVKKQALPKEKKPAKQAEATHPLDARQAELERMAKAAGYDSLAEAQNDMWNLSTSKDKAKAELGDAIGQWRFDNAVDLQRKPPSAKNGQLDKSLSEAGLGDEATSRLMERAISHQAVYSAKQFNEILDIAKAVKKLDGAGNDTISNSRSVAEAIQYGGRGELEAMARKAEGSTGDRARQVVEALTGEKIEPPAPKQALPKGEGAVEKGSAAAKRGKNTRKGGK